MNLMFTSKEEMDAWDAHIRSQLVARKKELGLSDMELGEKAFTGLAASPKGKLHFILNGQGAANNRKPQNIRAADLMNLCEALRLSVWDVMEGARKFVKETPKQ